MRTRLSLTLIVSLLGGSLDAQSAPAPPSATNRQLLSGTWKLDRSGPPEDEKNWNRAPHLSRSNAPDGSGRTGDMPAPIPEANKVYSIRTFGQTFIAASETLALNVQADAVTIRDDFREPTVYETTGRARSMEVLPGAARSVAMNTLRSITVSAKSSWNGAALVQEVWTRETREIVRITRTLIPYDEGRKMLFVIKVLEPKLKEPVKDIERVYLRQPS